MRKAKLTTREKRCWYLIHSSAFLWLLTGIVALSVFYICQPKQQDIHPANIPCKSPDTILINLGIDHFWLSSVMLSIASSADIYLASISCREAHRLTYTTILHSKEIYTVPYYLVQGSTYSVTNSDINNTVSFWVTQTALSALDCSIISNWNCSDSNETMMCSRAGPGERVNFSINISDYYYFCQNRRRDPKSLNRVLYNLTAVRGSSPRRISIMPSDSMVPITINKFLQCQEMCIFMSLSSSSCPAGEEELTMKIDVHFRWDIPVFMVLLGLLMSILHICISTAICLGLKKGNYITPPINL